jgi:hypothetical protein
LRVEEEIMSDRSMWKMLHLLYTLPPGRAGLTLEELKQAGIRCDPDTIQPLVSSGVVAGDAGRYTLTQAANRILGTCVVANRRWSSDDMWVDFPSVFVIMPFREPWSDTVYRQMIEPGVKQAGAAVPADIGGAHYFEYELQQLPDGTRWLASELKKLATENCSSMVKSLLGR